MSVPNGGFPELVSSTLRYVQDHAIAEEYDDFNVNNRLFDFDTDLLDQFTSEPGRLIDLGCGTGRHVAHFAERGFEVTGLDLSEHMLAVASDKIERADLVAEFIHRDIRDLSSLPGAHYDYVVCMFSTLGMVRGSGIRRSIVEQIHRILRPGGKFFVHAHNRWHHWYSIDRIIWLARNAVSTVFTSDEVGDLWMEWYRGIPNMYLHIFSVREMRCLLEVCGLGNIKIIQLNEARDGELAGTWFRESRSNGFIAAGTK